MSAYHAQLLLGGTLLFVYLIVMFLVTSSYIRLANLRWLRAHQAAFRGRAEVQLPQIASSVRARRWTRPNARPSAPDSPVDADALAKAIDRLVPDFHNLNDGPERGRSLRNWIGSSEIAQWVRLHEAQRLEVWRLPDAAVQARFARAMGQIDELPPVRQNAWQRRWAELQEASRRVEGAEAAAHTRWRAELSQLLAELFNARDATYNQLVSLYGKAGWLVLAAYLPVIALLVAGYGYVLIAGSVGGLISRVQRVVYGAGWPTAYGISWVPLFLAPLLGALTAWAGLQFIATLQALHVLDLSSLIRPETTFRDAPAPAVLGLAVLLGFSERLFNQLGSQAEKVLSGEDDTGSAAAAGSPTFSFAELERPGGDATTQQHARTKPRRTWVPRRRRGTR
ncbi:hypothetical protein [Planosporangium mesophilum]|uniref:Uncharacterized protein n=1 Tax=Planosporangium mesophilum TaxID=689768 RepID=A0A8J3TJM5_9ACTN|nr:hypothetical protein [Planosporangium mesophilum]NJC86361.1 hypothetical protein [Planosporangium mesophilum]GII25844.1 hypothetical protein Pme01_54410 [Planosporangium mesophilum]